MSFLFFALALLSLDTVTRRMVQVRRRSTAVSVLGTVEKQRTSIQLVQNPEVCTVHVQVHRRFADYYYRGHEGVANLLSGCILCRVERLEAFASSAPNTFVYGGDNHPQHSYMGDDGGRWTEADNMIGKPRGLARPTEETRRPHSMKPSNAVQLTLAVARY